MILVVQYILILKALLNFMIVYFTKTGQKQMMEEQFHLMEAQVHTNSHISLIVLLAKTQQVQVQPTLQPIVFRVLKVEHFIVITLIMKIIFIILLLMEMMVIVMIEMI